MTFPNVTSQTDSPFSPQWAKPEFFNLSCGAVPCGPSCLYSLEPQPPPPMLTLEVLA